MKVAFAMRYMDKMGGSEFQIANIFWQMNQVFEVIFWTSKLDVDLFPKLKDTNKVHVSGIRGYHWLKYYWIIDLFNFLRNEKPDILYSSDSRRIWLYTLLSKLFCIKIVWSINYSIEDTDFSLHQLILRFINSIRANKILPIWALFSYLNNKCLNTINIVCQSNEHKK